jgi:hypothetical protein
MEPIRLYAPSDLHGDPSRWWARLCPYPGQTHWEWKEGWRWRINFGQNLATGQRQVLRATVRDRDDDPLVEVVFSTKSHFVPNEAYSYTRGDSQPYVEFDGDIYVGPPAAQAFMVGGQVIDPTPKAPDDNRLDQILSILRNLDSNQTVVVGWVKDLKKTEKELDDRNRMLRDVRKEVEVMKNWVDKALNDGEVDTATFNSLRSIAKRIEVAAEIPF